MLHTLAFLLLLALGFFAVMGLWVVILAISEYIRQQNHERDEWNEPTTEASHSSTSENDADADI